MYDTMEDLVAAFWAEYERACMVWVKSYVDALMENGNGGSSLLD